MGRKADRQAIKSARLGKKYSRKRFMQLLYELEGVRKTEAWLSNLEQGLSASYTEEELIAIENLLDVPFDSVNAGEHQGLVEMIRTDYLKIPTQEKKMLFVEVSRRGEQSSKDPWIHNLLLGALLNENTRITIFTKKKGYILPSILIALNRLFQMSAKESIEDKIEDSVSRVQAALNNVDPLYLSSLNKQDYIFFQRMTCYYIDQELDDLNILLEKAPVSYFTLQWRGEDKNRAIGYYAFSSDSHYDRVSEKDCDILTSRVNGFKRCKHIKTLNFKESENNSSPEKEFYYKMTEHSIDYNIYWGNEE